MWDKNKQSKADWRKMICRYGQKETIWEIKLSNYMANDLTTEAEIL